MEKKGSEKNRGIILLAFIISSIYASMLAGATGFTNVCLNKGETIYFSQCNENMQDYTCSGNNCQLCVNEISIGVYCPASPNSCANACIRIYDSTENSAIMLVNPKSDAILAPGEVLFNVSASLPGTLQRCDLYINDVRKRYTLTPKDTNIFTVKNMEAGTYEWRVECKEKANYGEETIISASRILHLKEGAGENETGEVKITLIKPEESTIFTGGQAITFRFSLSGSILNIMKECSLYLDNSRVSQITELNLDNQIIYNVTVGTHNWKVSCNNGSYDSKIRNLVISPSGSGGGGGGGEGGNKTYSITQEQFFSGISKDLAFGDRLKWTFNNEEYYLKLLFLQGSIAGIEVSPQYNPVNMSVGTEKKFALDEDNYYDLYVKLESINYTSNQTKLKIKKIHEQMPFLFVSLTSWPNPGVLVYLYPEHVLTEEGEFQYSFENYSAVDTCLLFIDSEIVATSKNNESKNDFSKWNYLVTNFTTEDIKHTWKVFCNTTLGINNYSESRDLYFLTYSKLLAPEVHLTWPNNNQIFNYDDYIYLYFNYTNTSAIKDCSLFIDDNLIFYTNNTHNWTQENKWPNSTGTHSWYYSCTNVYGSIGNSQTRTYFVLAENIIPEDLVLIYDSADNELKDITGLFIGSNNFSEGIYFNENINLSKEKNLSELISMSKNTIFVDSTKAPWLNKMATLIFYGLTFSNPRILKDGVIFDTDFYYEDGILIFEVTGFSEYRVEETPGTSQGNSAGGGSGGGGGGGSGGTGAIVNTASNVQIANGYTKSFKKGEKIRFPITITPNGSNSSSRQYHTITIDEVNNGSVKIKIDSNPVEATLFIGEAQKFDFTSDGVYDILLRLNSVKNGKANITAKTINEIIEIEKLGDEENSTETAKEEETQEHDNTSSITGATVAVFNGIKSNPLAISAIIVLIVIIAVIWSYRKKKRKVKKK